MNKKIFPLLLLLPVVFLLGRLSAQEDVQPSCLMCAAEYLSLEEISKYMQVGRDKGITDQQLRSIDVGRAKVQIAVAHRGQLEQRIGRVAEHDLVTEVYYVLSGSGDIMTSPELIDSVRRADDNRAVMTLNGPGHNAADVRNAVSHQLKAGDVFIIPAGTGHEFTRIPDHITYLMIRVDPDKVVPLMNADESAKYLDEQL
ncbi:MAG: cupin domain-containing protein [Pseudomonadales bacterium]|jgi:mannose-6-phosphate isomerase-like protein (cupin superfamily)|nr:cupin domain-containing protein [Pseudomonadales bacterium]